MNIHRMTSFGEKKIYTYSCESTSKSLWNIELKDVCGAGIVAQWLRQSSCGWLGTWGGIEESQIGVDIFMGEEGEEKRPRASSRALKMGKASAGRVRDLPRAAIAGAGSPKQEPHL